MFTPTRNHFQRAIDKATRLGTLRTVEQVTDVAWLVRGTSQRDDRGRLIPTWHVVRLQGRAWTCDCEAGRRGLACYHAAAVWLSTMRDSLIVRAN